MVTWELDNPGAQAERDRCEKDGVDIPEELWPPELLPGASEWLERFWELSTDRQLGMSVGPIPAASIDRATADMVDTEAYQFRVCMRAMDSAFLAHNAAVSGGKKRVPTKKMEPEEFDKIFG